MFDEPNIGNTADFLNWVNATLAQLDVDDQEKPAITGDRYENIYRDAEQAALLLGLHDVIEALGPPPPAYFVGSNETALSGLRGLLRAKLLRIMECLEPTPDWYAIEGSYLDRRWDDRAVPVGLIDGKRRAEVIIQKLKWAFQDANFSLRQIDEIEAIVVTDEIAKVLRRGHGAHFEVANMAAEWDGKLPRETSPAQAETKPIQLSNTEAKDVALDDATMATAKAMHAYLQSLASGNTAVESMLISPLDDPKVTIMTDPDERQREFANKAKLFPGGVPTNSDIVDLVVRIDASKGSGESQRKIALKFTGGDRKKALSLLSQIRRLKREGRINL